ncbi:MAG: hypothetical protein FJ297_01315 [Planctomycetes bacterium]|nr:hypothetical protein [Planctomycetota bacterium]
MSGPSPSSGAGTGGPPTVGFVTVVAGGDATWIGGYLVLNTLGRPIEFHCTAPVRASRAQEILYGPTLQPFLFGEQIAQALVRKSSAKPLFVCTDLDPVLAVRGTLDTPVARIVVSDPGSNSVGEDRSRAGPGLTASRTSFGGESQESDGRSPRRACAVPTPFELGARRLEVANRFESDGPRIVELWRAHANELDLAEPFERIREAIGEARKAA